MAAIGTPAPGVAPVYRGSPSAEHFGSIGDGCQIDAGGKFVVPCPIHLHLAVVLAVAWHRSGHQPAASQVRQVRSRAPGLPFGSMKWSGLRKKSNRVPTRRKHVAHRMRSDKLLPIIERAPPR